MLIPYWLIKYIVAFNVVYWPLHALGVRDGIAYIFAFAAWVPTFEFFRRRRRRRFYDGIVREEMNRVDLPAESDTP